MQPLRGEFDLVCANLPYVSAAAKLPAEVTAQPARALYADEGGAALVIRLLGEAPARLRAGGRVLAEIDPSIAPAVSEVAARAYGGRRVHKDIAGHERVLESWC